MGPRRGSNQSKRISKLQECRFSSPLRGALSQISAVTGKEPSSSDTKASIAIFDSKRKYAANSAGSLGPSQISSPDQNLSGSLIKGKTRPSPSWVFSQPSFSKRAAAPGYQGTCSVPQRNCLGAISVGVGTSSRWMSGGVRHHELTLLIVCPRFPLPCLPDKPSLSDANLSGCYRNRHVSPSQSGNKPKKRKRRNPQRVESLSHVPGTDGPRGCKLCVSRRKSKNCFQERVCTTPNVKEENSLPSFCILQRDVC